jgi:hypothetical protein
VPEVLVIGQLCTYARRTPDTSKVAKIKNWPPYSSQTKVCGFLGTTGTVHNWIEDYAHIAHLLTNLTWINVPFVWDTTVQQAMDALKNAIVSCLVIHLTDYRSQDKVILVVDSSNIACSWILLQICNGECYPSHFGSITWNERESRYSQAKIELYGLLRALKAMKVWLIGLKQFMVEVDAKYIWGMLNNPDIHPNVAVNHWITGISLFDFTLRHVPGNKHVAPDGLSQ